MEIGVIDYQGDVEEHIIMMRKISSLEKIEIKKVKTVTDMKDISGIIIPGGESTTIYKLMKENLLIEEVKRMAEEGLPVMGTCAGLILISRETNDERVKGMNLIDIEIQRNGYGRQKESFSKRINIKNIGEYDAVFIRAPRIKHTGDCEIMASVEEEPVMVRNKNIIGLTFHPELTENTKIHEYFMNMVKGEGGPFPVEV